MTHASDCPLVALGKVVLMVLRQEVSHHGRMTGLPLSSHPLSAEMKHPRVFSPPFFVSFTAHIGMLSSPSLMVPQ